MRLLSSIRCVLTDLPVNSVVNLTAGEMENGQRMLQDNDYLFTCF